MNTTKKAYNQYATSFIKDGMEPLSYSEWVRVQKNAYKTELATPYGN